MVESPNFTSRFQEEAQKNMGRVQAVIDSFVVNPAAPPIDVTPHEVVWKRGKARLLRYRAQGQTANPLPYLIVPWLGISRPTCWTCFPATVSSST